METVNLILGGLGGQGILFMTKIMARAALLKGFNVMGAETHGMAQRGGSVVSHLRLGEVQSSLVRHGTAQFVLALEESEAYRNIPFLATGARLYASAAGGCFPREEAAVYLKKKGVVSRAVEADRIAAELGAPMAANLALLGYFSAFREGPVTYEDMKETIDRIGPERFRTRNLKVFNAGYEKGTRQKAAS